MSDNEARLIQRLQRSEASAFQELVETHKQRVFTLAYHFTRHVQDAEDLSQEAFIKAFRSINGFRGEAQLSSWLYRIVVNLALNRRRKKALSKMELRESFEGDEAHPAQASAAPEYDPESVTEAKFMRTHLREALDKLSEQQRTIFVLRHDGDMPLQQISAVLKLSEGTVKSQLFRGLRKLQKQLAFYKTDLGIT
jgi:RNA polymerase sigma-70 factor (ECF subfamily)